MPNGVMSFPSNHEFNVKPQLLHVIKKAKSLHQNKNSGQNLYANFEPISKAYYK